MRPIAPQEFLHTAKVVKDMQEKVRALLQLLIISPVQCIFSDQYSLIYVKDEHVVAGCTMLTYCESRADSGRIVLTERFSL